MLLCATSVSAQTVEAWLTSPSNGKRLEKQADQVLSASAAAAQCIDVTEATEYQTVDGFGWMLTEGSAKLLKGLHSTVRRDILNELYSVEDGLGASIVRIAIGACDLSESDYTYSMTKDETLSNFSLDGPDADYVLPVLKEILAINPDVKIMAVPWTAPIWMKTNNAYVGGELKTAYYPLYAQYFVRYLQAMEAEGIHIWAVTPQNEPLHGGNNPSMTFTQMSEYQLVDQHLGPALAAAGYGNVKIIGYDHNCDNIAFPVQVAKSSYCAGSAFHLYGGDISALKNVYDRTKKDVYFTEQYTGANGDFGGDFSWHMQNVMLGSMLNMSRCAIEWNLAADANSQPHTQGGCSDCKGALTIGSTKVSSRNVSYYIVGQMSQVVRTGAKRIGASGASNFQVAAFRNPDGSLAVVAYNKGSQQQLSLRFGGNVVTYTVPGSAAISLLLPGAFAPFEPSLLPAIESAVLDPASPMYNILGQPVEGNYRGIVIQNGRKFYLN